MDNTKKAVIYDNEVPLSAASGLSLASLMDRARLTLLYLRAAILIPIGIVRSLLAALLYVLSLYRTIFYVALITLLWYLLVIYWPYFMLVIINVLIPITNVLILLFNLGSAVLLIILRIVIMIWNIFVPFIGIFIMVVVNLFFTIIGDIFDAIGSINFEPIVGAFIQIISVLVDIIMKVIGIIIKIGTPILIQFSKIVTTLVEVIMTAVKILLPIVMWIINSLFKLLEPILDVVSWYFGGIASIFGMSASSTGRSLLSLKMTPDVFDLNDEAYERYLDSVKAPPPRGTGYVDDDYMMSLYKKHYTIDESLVPSSRSFDAFASSGSGRKILETYEKEQEVKFNGKKLKFKDGTGTNAGATEKDDASNGGDPHRPSDTTLNEYSNQMAYQFYKSARQFGHEDLTLANHLMREVLSENNRKDNIAMRAIIKDFNAQYGHLESPFEHTLSNVKIRGVVEHPEELRTRLKARRKDVRSVLVSSGASAGARHLLETDFDKNKEQYLSQRKIDEAKAIAAQEMAYREHELTRMKFVTVAYNSASKALKTNIEDYVSPGDLVTHWDDTLRYFGYQSINEVREEFINTHADGAGFVESLNWIGDHPIFSYFSRMDEHVLPDNVRFLNWEEEQRAMREVKAASLNGTRAGGRSLLEVTQQNQDVNVAGSKESKESFGAFPMISTRNCFSNPKNKMCIPQIPASFKPRLGLIRLTADQKRALTTYVIFCSPWYTTFALIDLYRLFNVLQELRFFISAIPFFNRNIATLTKIAPWTGLLLDWVFLIPKYQNASLFQWVCWVNHLFDIWVWGVAVWIASKLFSLIWPILVGVWNNLSSVRINVSSGSFFYKQRLKTLDRILSRAMARGEINAQIGDDIHPNSHHLASVVKEQYIGTTINSGDVHHHHHYHTDSKSPMILAAIDDEEIRKEAYEREMFDIHSQLLRTEGESESLRFRLQWLITKFQQHNVVLDLNDIDHKSLNRSRHLIDNHPIHRILRERGIQLLEAPATLPACSSNASLYSGDFDMSPK